MAEAGLPRPASITEVVDSSGIVHSTGEPVVKRACPQVANGSAGDPAALLEQLPQRLVADPAVVLPIRVGITLTGPRQARAGVVVTAEGAEVTRGPLDDAEASIRVDADAFAAILEGRVAARELVLCDGARVTGDLNRASELVQLFVAPARP